MNAYQNQLLTLYITYLHKDLTLLKCAPKIIPWSYFWEERNKTIMVGGVEQGTMISDIF